ncbi:MAG TPA: GlsB/YeaQ/YmgE family stress response membrane protein [Microlunatus sp.]|nr:GlsB/YeaQ/YmgE family stress response membrane protein [Microlunatus sp.]
MGIIGWILIGLIMGALAKAALNKKSGGWLSTLLIGVIGALVGGFLGSVAFGRGIGSFFSPWTWLLAFVGSVIVLAIWSAISGRSKA